MTAGFLLYDLSLWHLDDFPGYRINSNDYMYSLVYDFGFEVKRYVGYTTADIFPPTHNAFVVVWNVLENYLVQDGSFNGQIDCIHQYYIEGWSK